MVEANNYQMAIDLLCYHLGISEDEALKELGLPRDQTVQQHIAETQQALMGISNEK